MTDRFRYDLIEPGAKVLCALSGGADSMYLLCRLLEGAQRGGYTVRAAHYDHKLRPTAGRDVEFVRDRCAEKEIPLTVGEGEVAARAAALGLGLEECARQMRYAFLEETAEQEGCTLIATGHQAGDNAETVLMHLIRGCGLHGLTGIPVRRGKIVRPMLEISRAEIDAYLAAHRVPHVEDESNGDESYTRNKVRRRLIPLLEELNPRAAEHIAATARRLAEDEGELARQGAELARQARERPDGWEIPARALTEAPRPVALRAVGQLLDRAGLSTGRAFWPWPPGRGPPPGWTCPEGACGGDTAWWCSPSRTARALHRQSSLWRRASPAGEGGRCPVWPACARTRPMWGPMSSTCGRGRIPCGPGGREIASGWGAAPKRPSKS